MKATLLLTTLLLVACATVAGAATPAPSKAKAKRPVRRAAATAPAANATPAGPRRLDDIHIEGEIPVPQVLFVSAREQRRFLDFQQARWLRSARQLGESTPVPTTVVRSTNPVTRAEETHR